MYAFRQCLFRSLNSNHENVVLEANGWYTRYLFFKTENISCYLYCNEGRFKRNSKKYNCFLFFKKKKTQFTFPGERPGSLSLFIIFKQVKRINKLKKVDDGRMQSLFPHNKNMIGTWSIPVVRDDRTHHSQDHFVIRNKK